MTRDRWFLFTAFVLYLGQAVSDNAVARPFVAQQSVEDSRIWQAEAAIASLRQLKLQSGMIGQVEWDQEKRFVRSVDGLLYDRFANQGFNDREVAERFLAFLGSAFGVHPGVELRYFDKTFAEWGTALKFNQLLNNIEVEGATVAVIIDKQQRITRVFSSIDPVFQVKGPAAHPETFPLREVLLQSKRSGVNLEMQYFLSPPLLSWVEVIPTGGYKLAWKLKFHGRVQQVGEAIGNTGTHVVFLDCETGSLIKKFD